ncbi:MAG: hypothetical protein KA383_01755 [Phycisphaerae bacterium]|nr:hypothetical protein [Phycisphaerae bacterium]
MKDVLLIGVDGGATEVKAHAVMCDDLAQASAFRLRPETASRVYQRLSDFTPLPVADQLAQRDAGGPQLTAAEVEQGRVWIAAAAEVVIDVARQCNARRVLVGEGMPGLKTPDGRGINVINNGPRMPTYLADLERRLADAQIELAAPVAALGSDADYCGLGEEYAAEGLFRDVQNAYYVGGGTGIADAMKLRGRLVPFDAAKPWLQKSWQMPSALGPTFEKLVSASSLNRVWADLQGPRALRHAGTQGGDAASPYPETAALAGDPRAAAWLDTAALVLAELIFERLSTIFGGRAEAPHRGPAYAKLATEHEFRGVLLERVIIGQRVGLIYVDPRYRGVFGERLDTYLAANIAHTGDSALCRAFLTDGSGTTRQAVLKPGFLRASRLRAAPALGAAVAAVKTRA